MMQQITKNVNYIVHSISKPMFVLDTISKPKKHVLSRWYTSGMLYIKFESQLDKINKMSVRKMSVGIRAVWSVFGVVSVD